MLKRLDIVDNPNVGVFVLVTEDIAIIPFNLSDEKIEDIKEALDVDILQASLSGSNLIGSLAIANSNGIIVSPHTFDKEIKVLEDYGLNVAKLPDRHSAVGNVIAANDNGAIASPFISNKSLEVIEEVLDVNVEATTIADKEVVGSLISVTNNGFLINKDASSREIDLAHKTFGVEGDIGTVGRGISFVGSCCIANSKGAIVANTSTGPEMARVEEALGFLDAF